MRANNIKKYTMLEGAAGFNTPLFSYARTLVRAAEEFPKPNDQRLSEFNDSDKPSLELRLFSRQPLYADFELAKLADSLGWLCEILGYNTKAVQAVLDGKSPRARAAELMQGTKLFDVDERKKLYEGGRKAVDASEDSMIRLARIVDKESRAVRKIMENQLEEPRRQAYDRIAHAKFATLGTGTYPDATFTLRLAFGTVKGYEEAANTFPLKRFSPAFMRRPRTRTTCIPSTSPRAGWSAKAS